VVTGPVVRRLYLVRHGAALGAAGRAIGHSDPPLSARGRRAVERLAATWQGPPPDRLLTSPLARAAATASLLAAAWGAAPARPEPRLAEMSFGAWDGRRWDEVHAADGERFAAWAERWWQAAAPDGEGFADLARRVGEWWDAWREETVDGAMDGAPPGEAAGEAGAAGREGPAGSPRSTVVVTHAGPVRALLTSRLGVPHEGIWDVSIGLARVTAIDVAAGEPPRLVFLDRPSFLRARGPA
jgi:broad specificity phosphatase PhoE